MANSIKFASGLGSLPSIPLDEIDTTFFPNSRDSAANAEAVSELRNSIHQEGLMTAPTLAASEKGKSVVAGFSRLLALQQLAVMPLFNKANEGKKVKDDDYVDLNNPEHMPKVQALDPKAYQEAIHAIMVPYVLVEVEDKQHAAVLNLTENVVRENLSTRDLTRRVVTILDDKDSPMKATKLAKMMGCTEGKISQWRKVGDMESSLPIYITTPEEGETLSDDQLAQLKTLTGKLMAEYITRLGLPKDSVTVIPFIHARELSYRIAATGTRKPISRLAALTAFKRLLGWSETANDFDPNRRTPDFSIFQQMIENAVKATAVVSEAAETGAVGGTEVAAAEAIATSAETPVTEATAVVAGMPVTGAAVAGTQVSADDILDKVGTPTAGATGTQPVVATVPPAGPGTRQVKAGQAMPDKDKYAKARSHTEIDAYAGTCCMELAPGTENRVADVAMYLGQASGFYEVLGLDDEQRLVDDFYDQYATEVEVYIELLERVALSAKKAKMPFPIKGKSYDELFDDDDKPLRPVFEADDNEEASEASDEAAADAAAVDATAKEPVASGK